VDLGLSGKRVVVAAASGGLGHAIAMELAREGCQVTIGSRDAERVNAAATAIGDATGATVRALVCDVSAEGSVRTFVEDAAALMGGLDLVVPNAGGPPYGMFGDLTPAQWDDAYRLVLASAVSFARHARPLLGRGSAMLFMTSTSVREPIGTLLLSTVFRSGVAALAKALATEWASSGIRVNHLIPGRISTERVRALDEESARRRGADPLDVREGIEASIPLGRYGEPDEYARAAVFLLSDAASYITGATLQVDGGMLHGV
jgi:3-oxoacyl-[acyl-carrier protein] reductase